VIYRDTIFRPGLALRKKLKQRLPKKKEGGDGRHFLKIAWIWGGERGEGLLFRSRVERQFLLCRERKKKMSPICRGRETGKGGGGPGNLLAVKLKQGKKKKGKSSQHQLGRTERRRGEKNVELYYGE